MTLVVSDVEKSKQFYKKALGLDPGFEKEIYGEHYSRVTGFPGLRLKFAVLKLPGSKAVLELAQFISPQQKTHPDFRHIAFEVDDIDALFKKLKGLGMIAVSEPVTISGQGKGLDGKRFFYFKDPDGNLIEAYNKTEGLYSG